MTLTPPGLRVLIPVLTIMIATTLWLGIYTNTGIGSKAKSSAFTTALPDAETLATLHDMENAMGVTVNQYRVFPDCSSQTMAAWTSSPYNAPHPATISYCQAVTDFDASAFMAIMAHEMAHVQYHPRFWPYLVTPLAVLMLGALWYLIRDGNGVRILRGVAAGYLVVHVAAMGTYRYALQTDEYRADAVAAELTSGAALREGLSLAYQLKTKTPTSCSDKHNWLSAAFCILTLGDLVPSHPSI